MYSLYSCINEMLLTTLGIRKEGQYNKMRARSLFIYFIPHRIAYIIEVISAGRRAPVFVFECARSLGYLCRYRGVDICGDVMTTHGLL